MSHGGFRKGSGAKPAAGTARLHKIDVRVNEADLAEIDARRGSTPRSVYLREAGTPSTTAARAGVRSAKEKDQ